MELFTKEAFADFFSGIPLEEVLKVTIIIVVGLLLIRLLRIVMKRLVFSRTTRQTQMIGLKLINYISYLILILIVLAELGISVTALLGAAGILGIALGVASQKSLGNLISGLFIITEKSFEIGDVISVGDKTGVVHSIEILSVMLKTFDNLLIRIPNETLISTDITNITRFPVRRMDIIISVAYRSDLQQVLKLLQGVGKANQYALNEPEPFVMIQSFDDSGITIKFGIWFEKTQFVDTKNSIMGDIHRAFRTEGIEIPFPQVSLNYPIAAGGENKPLQEQKKS